MDEEQMIQEQAMQQQQATQQEEKFEYKRNPSSDVMARREVGTLRKQDEEVAAAEAAAQQQAQIEIMNSPEAQRKNAFISDKIRNGSLDPQTAQIVMQDQMVAPQLKEMIGQIMSAQQPASEAQMQHQEPQVVAAGVAGLGAIG